MLSHLVVDTLPVDRPAGAISRALKLIRRDALTTIALEPIRTGAAVSNAISANTAVNVSAWVDYLNTLTIDAIMVLNTTAAVGGAISTSAAINV